MFRALAPYVLVALVVMCATGVFYGLGAPAWLFYAGIVVAVLAMLPGVTRWDQQQHHPR
jgi:hypothetical protein